MIVDDQDLQSSLRFHRHANMPNPYQLAASRMASFFPLPPQVARPFAYGGNRMSGLPPVARAIRRVALSITVMSGCPS
jgi:hypothetical protein